MKYFLYSFFSRLIYFFLNQHKLKYLLEFWYWKIKYLKEKNFTNHHFIYLFTDNFGLDYNFYKNKKILDIGCGPRGSLEWADHTTQRIGLDPIADKYQKLGINNHKMTYIKGFCEKQPFPDNYFDVVSSFNSLDHFDDLDLSIKEIKRILKKGGIFLLITNIHADRHLCEPIPITWEVIEKFKPEFEVISEKHFEGNRMYKSIRKGMVFNHNNKRNRNGILTTSFYKK